MANSSGVGTYITNLDKPPAANLGAAGAYINLGYVFITVRLWVSGQWTGPIHVSDPVVDVSSYLANGPNEVRMEVMSTLRNRLLQVNVIRSWEHANYSATYGPQPCGLQQPVVLKP